MGIEIQRFPEVHGTRDRKPRSGFFLRGPLELQVLTLTSALKQALACQIRDLESGRLPRRKVLVPRFWTRCPVRGYGWDQMVLGQNQWDPILGWMPVLVGILVGIGMFTGGTEF